MKNFIFLFVCVFGLFVFNFSNSEADDQWVHYKNSNGWKIKYPKSWYSNIGHSPMGDIEIEFRNWDGYDPAAMNATLIISTLKLCQRKEVTIELCVARQRADPLLGSIRYLNFKGYPAFEIKGESDGQAWRHLTFRIPTGETFSLYTNLPTKEKSMKSGLTKWSDPGILNQMIDDLEVFPIKKVH